MGPTPDFPWGDRYPEGGYRIGDRVGLIYSDHTDYIFDNPTGIVTEVEEDSVTVQIEVSVDNERVYLIERGATETKKEKKP
jgi:hypothetical protein